MLRKVTGTYEVAHPPRDIPTASGISAIDKAGFATPLHATTGLGLQPQQAQGDRSANLPGTSHAQAASEEPVPRHFPPVKRLGVTLGDNASGRPAANLPERRIGSIERPTRESGIRE